MVNKENTEKVQQFMVELIALCRKYNAYIGGDDTRYYPDFGMAIDGVEVHNFDVDRTGVKYILGDEDDCSEIYKIDSLGFPQ